MVRNILFKITIFIFISLFVGTACEVEESSGRLLGPASGTPGEIIVVMDSIQWQGELGEALREALETDVPGVSRSEPMFTVRYIEPSRFNSVLQKAANLIFVATLDSKTEGGRIVRNFMTKNYIQEHPDKFIISQKDIYASGQNALYLFSASEKELAQHIRDNKEVIRSFFNKKEIERLKKKLYRNGEQKKVEEYLANKYGYTIRIPAGYQIAADDSAFFWLRKPGPYDLSVFITYKPYHSEEQLSDAGLIAFRDSITFVKIFEDPADPATYTRVDTTHNDTMFKTIDFNGHYARTMRGIWYSNTKTLGGAFTSIVVLDEKAGRLYLIDGFVIAPNKDKSASLRELETIISTFKVVDQKEAPDKKQAS